jgi:hypothetical protein
MGTEDGRWSQVIIGFQMFDVDCCTNRSSLHVTVTVKYVNTSGVNGCTTLDVSCVAVVVGTRGRCDLYACMQCWMDLATDADVHESNVLHQSHLSDIFLQLRDLKLKTYDRQRVVEVWSRTIIDIGLVSATLLIIRHPLRTPAPCCMTSFLHSHFDYTGLHNSPRRTRYSAATLQ